MLYPRMVLARLQAKCKKEEPAAASTAEAVDPEPRSKNKKPKKGVRKDIEEKLLPEKASCLMCIQCWGGCLLWSQFAKYIDCRCWTAFGP